MQAQDAEDGVLHSPADGVGTRTVLFVCREAARYVLEIAGFLFLNFLLWKPIFARYLPGM